MGFYEFHITLANQKTGQTMEFTKNVPYSKEYLDAWKYVSQIAFEALDAMEVDDKAYWYIAKIEQYI